MDQVGDLRELVVERVHLLVQLDRKGVAAAAGDLHVRTPIANPDVHQAQQGGVVVGFTALLAGLLDKALAANHHDRPDQLSRGEIGRAFGEYDRTSLIVTEGIVEEPHGAQRSGEPEGGFTAGTHLVGQDVVDFLLGRRRGHTGSPC